MTKTVEQLRAELRKAEQAEEAAAKTRREATPPVWQFTLSPTTQERVYDDTVVAYTLRGEVINRDECLTAGRAEYELRGGAMVYLFNTGTGKLIAPVGGGTIYISSFYPRNREAEAKVIDQISDFLVAHPEGGDITEVVNAFRKETRNG